MKIDHFHKLAIIIPYHRGRRYLYDCLKSIQDASTTKVVATVYLIVNDGSDLHSDVIPTDLRLKIFQAKRNIGYSRSVNIGLFFAKLDQNDFYLILNQDTILHTHCLNEMIDSAQKKRLKDCVFSPIFLSERSSVYDPLTHHQKVSGQLREVSFIEGAAYLMSRKTLANLQYYDPLYHMYFEDSDLVYRLQKLGGRLMVVPKAAIFHHNSDHDNDRGQKAKKAVAIRTSAMISNLRFKGRFSARKFILGFCKDLMKSLVYTDPDLAILSLKLYSRIITHRKDITVINSQNIARRALKYINQDLISKYFPGASHGSKKDLKALATNSKSS